MGAANHDVLGEGGRRGHAGGEKQSRNNIAGTESGTWGHFDLLWSAECRVDREMLRRSG
jgi:hypothetical protein